MRKKWLWVCCILLSFFCLSGCAARPLKRGAGEAEDELQRLQKIEVYWLGEEETLVIEDTETLEEFNVWNQFEPSVFEDGEQWEKKLMGHDLLCTITTYKKPAALINDGTLEKNLTISVYQDTNIIQMEVAPDVIKGISVPESYLSFYCELSDKKLAFLLSLAEGEDGGGKK